MARKTYVIEHEWDADTAVVKLKPFVTMITGPYDLKMVENSSTSYTFTRPGVRADVTIGDHTLTADVELNMLLEGIVRHKLEDIIDRKIRPMFKKQA